MANAALLNELVKGLQEAGAKNISEQSVANAMANIAKPIADAIEKGANFNFIGSLTCEEINALQTPLTGDVYLCTNAGTLAGSIPLNVEANTAVIFDGSSWNTFFKIDLDNYETKADAKDKAHNFGILMRKNGFNTLQFIRPIL